ncbi:hypothetical protein [Pedobacter sp. V48]|uniref:hypothetical protein n=1 Tax=Pedobacter sp. V48 TaxID=509635 RepID=UPI001377674A|nr:hypothetical protein [Pedobacter sp. V48]
MADELNLSELRNLYYRAAENKESAFRLSGMLKTVNTGSPSILVCYKGVSEMMEAKYLINPFNKLSKFKNGRKLIEHAVKTNPDHVEIRFLRFCIQTNLPGFLGYKDHIKGDKVFLIGQVNKINDAELKQKVKEYLFNSKYCSSEELKKI